MSNVIDGIETEVEVMNLSLELAQLLAATIPDYQREVSDNRIALHAQSMAEGRWKFVGDAMVLRCDPETRAVVAAENAQHRILARIKAGDIPHEVPILVARRYAAEPDLDTYLVMDTGRPRALADFLKAHGETDVFNRASVTTLCTLLDTSPDGLYPAGKTVVPMDLAGEWWKECDRDLLGLSLKRARQLQTAVKGTSVRLLGAMYYIGARDWDIEGMDRFFDIYRTGNDPDPDSNGTHPAILLRNKQIEWTYQSSRIKVDARIRWMHAVRALHGHAVEERPVRLIWRPGRDRSLPVVSDAMAAEHEAMEPAFLAKLRAEALDALVREDSAGPVA